MHIGVCAYRWIHVRACVHVCVYVYVLMCTFGLHVRVCVCVCVYLSVCMYACICMFGCVWFRPFDPASYVFLSRQTCAEMYLTHVPKVIVDWHSIP
jgi:hypothetical protein